MQKDIFYYREKHEYESSWIDSVFNSRFVAAQSPHDLQTMVTESEDSPVNIACGLTAIETITSIIKQNPDVRFNVFHLSDEWYELSSARDLYESENVNRIFRVYYIPPPLKLIVNIFLFFPVCVGSLAIETFQTCMRTEEETLALVKHFFSTVRYALGFLRHQLRGSLFLWSDKISKKLVFMAPGPNEFFTKGKLEALKSCGPTNSPPQKYDCSFAGHDHNLYRKNAIRLIRELENVFIHTTDDWSLFSKKSLSAEEYALSILQSKAVCCAIGHVNAETFRLYEVLDGQSTPLGVTHTVYQPYNYYKMFLGIGMMPKPIFTFGGAMGLWKRNRQCFERHQKNLHKAYQEHINELRREFSTCNI